MTQYDKDFYQYTNSVSEIAAKKIIAIIRELFSEEIGCVGDFGCGQGVWLAEWERSGAKFIRGFDGPWVDRGSLRISLDDFEVIDFETGFCRFQCDVAQCLEVAEHVSSSASAKLIESLTMSANIVFFSAAPPGQGGIGHINERNYEEWRHIFNSFGYEVFDVLRPKILIDKTIPAWYRYNCLLYVKADSERFTQLVQSGLSPLDSVTKIPDISPWWYQFRKLIIRSLPLNTAEFLARIVNKWF